MMWELIAANKRKSFLLFVGMAALLLALGYFIGEATIGHEGGGWIGLIIATAVWVIMSAASVFGGPELVLKMSHAKEVTPDVAPQLFNVVEEMRIAAGLTKTPKVYIIDEKAPNAFATGLKPEDSSIAVTAGLLTRLNRDELQGVVAHEASHIMNRDSQFLTLASIMLGSIVLISQVFLRGMWFSGGGSSRRYRSGKDSSGGGGGAIIMVAAIVLAILAPLFARLLYLSISRKREYLADACAVQLTRYPEGLASALEKISDNDVPLEAANKVTAPMFIADPLALKGVNLSGWSSTHPPIAERVAILRAMSQGASLVSYEHAFAKATGKASRLIPASALRADKNIAIRAADPNVVKAQSEKKDARDVMDLMRAVNGYAFLVCACGLKIKVPPDMKETEVKCPRCGRTNEIPRAQVAEFAQVAAAVGAIVGTQKPTTGAAAIPFAQPLADAPGPQQPLEYQRRTPGEWETFSCSCGHTLQLSPLFSATQMKCPNCGTITRIV
jgi:heat shock protein HtpX